MLYQTVRVRLARVLISSLVSISIIGCATTTNNYYWGHYEGLIYEMYNNEGRATPDVQIEKINRDLVSALSRGQPVAPGVYAHLGLMYAAVGDMPKAEQAFNKEKLLFPESTILIDGMLNRAQRMSARQTAEET